MEIRQNNPLAVRIPPAHLNPHRFIEHSWFSLGRNAADLYTRLMFKMDVICKAPIPAGAKILLANHPNTLDPALMTTLVREQVSILITEILFKIPLFGRSLKLSGHIRVDQANGKASLEEGLRYLAAGRTLGIFPEGIISPEDGSLHHFHTGAARLAIAGRVPVIPIGIALEPNYLWRTRSQIDGRTEIGTWYIHGPYAVTVGEALLFEGDPEDREYVRFVTEQVRQQVAALTLESARRIRAARRNLVSTRLIETVRYLYMLTRGALRAT